jgi:hypothetical protein
VSLVLRADVPDLLAGAVCGPVLDLRAGTRAPDDLGEVRMTDHEKKTVANVCVWCINRLNDERVPESDEPIHIAADDVLDKLSFLLDWVTTG